MFTQMYVEEMDDERLCNIIDRLTPLRMMSLFTFSCTTEGHSYWSDVSSSFYNKRIQLEAEKLKREIAYAKEADEEESEITLMIDDKEYRCVPA